MSGERGAGLLAVAGHDVEHALGQMLLADGREPQHAQRCVLGGLQHQRVAGAQGGRDLERAEDDRRIPGNDGADHADRLAPRVAQHVLAQRDGLALELAGEAAEVAQDVGCALGLGAGLRADGIAGLLGDDAGELLHPRLDGIGDLLQHAAALARDDAAPAGEGLARGLHGAVDILGAAARNAGDDLAVAGRFYRYFLARRASTQLPSISICARLPAAVAAALLIATAIAASSCDRARLVFDHAVILHSARSIGKALPAAAAGSFRLGATRRANGPSPYVL